MFRWCVLDCVGNFCVLFRWCLAHVWVVCRLCFGGVFVLFCCFGGLLVLFWWWFADVLVVSRLWMLWLCLRLSLGTCMDCALVCRGVKKIASLEKSNLCIVLVQDISWRVLACSACVGIFCRLLKHISIWISLVQTHTFRVLKLGSLWELHSLHLSCVDNASVVEHTWSFPLVMVCCCHIEPLWYSFERLLLVHMENVHAHV